MATTQVPYTYNPDGTKSLAPNFCKYDNPADFQWEANTPFYATLEVLSSNKAIILLKNTQTDDKYVMLCSYLIEVIRADMIFQGKITGTWEVYKHGQAYGVKLI